jgi:hypothetical protein
MKILSEKQALQKLGAIREKFAASVQADYEHRAKSCLDCETPGACCLDEHFVNVRISRLEALAIRRVLDELPQGMRDRVDERIFAAVKKIAASHEGSAPAQTYACPLFEKGFGCMVHSTAKPLPCIHHACYENAADLPPDELLSLAEIEVDRLNHRTYLKTQPLLPLPVSIMRSSGSD